MSRLSDYTQADIEERTKAQGFDYLEGKHINGSSGHLVRCLGCGGKQVKRSRLIVNDLKCIFQPCSYKGKITLAFLANWARNNDMTCCFSPTLDEPASVLVGRDEVLVWRMGDKDMTKSWGAVFDRVRNDQIPYFVPDGKRVNLKRTSFRVRKNIRTVEDAVHFIEGRKIKSWGVAAKKFPDFCNLVIQNNWKLALFAHFGWTPRMEYSVFRDDELIDYAVDIFLREELENEDYSIGQFEDDHSGLISRLRKRSLVQAFYDRIGRRKKMSWVGYTYDDALTLIKKMNYASSTELHENKSGLYKFLNRNEWLDDISVEMDWGGDYADSSGRKWLTRGEAYLASLLLAAHEPFEAHPRLPFRGIRGGMRFADFYLPSNNLWVEVWGFFSEPDQAAAYAANRANKESQYRDSKFMLCAIEGRILYSSTEIDGIVYGRGKGGFISHCRVQLAMFGITV